MLWEPMVTRVMIILRCALFLPMISSAFGPHSMMYFSGWQRRIGTGGQYLSTGLAVKNDNNNDIQIREWRAEDFDDIQSLLGETIEATLDPEGPLHIDCGSKDAIQESYQDGGGFWVATTTTAENPNAIVGTIGLILGTQIQYLQSGASLSTPERITGAIRRVCCKSNGSESSNDSGFKNVDILRALLKEAEDRARQQGATDLILLAYPPSFSSANAVARPPPALVEDLDFAPLPISLGVATAVQYTKSLLDEPKPSKSSVAAIDNTNNAASGSDSSVLEVAVGVALLSGLLVAALGIANLLGLELVSSQDNGGIGTPLTRQELIRLQHDEILQRTDLDDGNTNRRWEDLSDEERREEVALMKIIQGQDVRIRRGAASSSS